MRAIDQFVQSRAEEGTAEYLRLYESAFERVIRLFEQTDNLRDAQRGGIAVFWEHDFGTLLDFVGAAR